jgi:hypothetical protein
MPSLHSYRGPHSVTALAIMLARLYMLCRSVGGTCNVRLAAPSNYRCRPFSSRVWPMPTSQSGTVVALRVSQQAALRGSRVQGSGFRVQGSGNRFRFRFRFRSRRRRL